MGTDNYQSANETWELCGDLAGVGGRRGGAKDVKQPEFNGVVVAKCPACPVVLAALLMRLMSRLQQVAN